MSDADDAPREYEVLREVWRITEWRDGAVFKTERQGIGWYDEATVKANRPADTNLTYTAPPTSALPYEGSWLMIRSKRKQH